MPDVTSGLDLKVERVKARVTAKSLATALGVTRQRVSAIEALAVVGDAQAERYRTALVSLTQTPQNTASAA